MGIGVLELLLLTVIRSIGIRFHRDHQLHRTVGKRPDTDAFYTPWNRDLPKARAPLKRMTPDGLNTFPESQSV